MGTLFFDLKENLWKIIQRFLRMLFLWCRK
nr:MAG TPA: hypothetical protein [Caudoviricetes sp.]